MVQFAIIAFDPEPSRNNKHPKSLVNEIKAVEFVKLSELNGLSETSDI